MCCWVTSEITCLYWVQRMPQTAAPQAWRWWPLWHSSESSLSLYEGKLLWNKKAKQWHGCTWSCVASFYSKSSLCLPDKVYQCLFSFCWYILIWPNWPCSPCCHSVSKTGGCFWPVTIFSWCKQSTKPAAFMPFVTGFSLWAAAFKVPWYYWSEKMMMVQVGHCFVSWHLLGAVP